MRSRLNRREFLRTARLSTAGLVVASMSLSDASPVSATQPRKPNIIVILGDDVGYGDVGCYGATKVKTPNVDRLASEGVRFLDAHTPSAMCSPTRYGLLTGRYAWRGRLKRWFCMPNDPLLIERDRPTVASLLSAAGYRTGYVGKWHLGFGTTCPDWTGTLAPGPLEVGFDYYFGVPVSNNSAPFVYVENHRVVDAPEAIARQGGATTSRHTSPLKRKPDHIALTQTAKAVQFIERNRAGPFFLVLATCNVHIPLIPHRRFRGTSQAGTYGDFLQEFDWTVGQVTETLDRLALTEHTVLIVTSDNGAMRFGTKYGHRSCGALRGQKSDIWEGGHRVPFVARWPGRIKGGTISREVICLTDLMATAAAIVGLDVPDGAGEDSYNVLPALLGERRDEPIREATVHHSGAGMFAIRQGRWKLVLGRGSGGISSPRWFTPPADQPQGQLYDLVEDPSEQANLWAQQPQVVGRLTKLLDRYRKDGRSRPL